MHFERELIEKQNCISRNKLKLISWLLSKIMSWHNAGPIVKKN